MRRLLQLLPLLWISFSAIAQETNCGNGIDDDGDGFIDCFDGDCATSGSCKDFYVGRDKLCQVPPSGAAQFAMKIGAKSANRRTWTSGRLDVGDLDNDGIPEIISLHPDDKKLYILDGRDLSVKSTGSITATAEYFDHAIGNINNDSCSEIFIAENDNGTYYISCYDCKGNLIWRKAIYDEPITMGLADFDQDGKVELYYRNEILDAATGTRLVKGSGSWKDIDAGPVAVDILDVSASCAKCSGLELVLGGTIYAVDLGNRTADAGSLISAKTIPNGAKYYPKYSSGFKYVTSLTSIADYTLDGNLDVIMSGSTGSTTGTTSVFLWDVKNNTYKIFQPGNDWQHGTGRINIADIDGDGKPNATFVSGNKLFALKPDFTQFWSVNINESTSGYTSTTVFDFNNDNAVEIVYRDEAYLYIINGKNGVAFTQANCRSRTANEYPVVADVDGDGSTEICVTCATNDADDINDINTRANGQIRTFKSNLEAWVPARKVWNQHGYFNVNINDNLTIPKIQQKHHLIFSTGSCTTGPNRALNTFLNQSPFLDSKGCPTYASADITYDASSVKIVPPTCPDQNFTISLDIKNIGDLGLSGTLPITFYQGNPTQAGAIKLNTVNINLSNFNVGSAVSLTDLSVSGTGNNFTLYVVLNDNGTTVPTPIKLPNSTFSECNYTNNIISAAVKPAPFSIQASLISNNIKCGSSSVPDNGAAEAYRLVGTTKVTAGYNFYWFNGTTVGDTATAAFKGSVRTGLAAGTYTVVAYHKGVVCGSTSTQVVVGNQTKSIAAVIKELSPYTNCKNPDGSMQVTLNGGDPSGNFTYQWFEGNVFGTSPTLSTSDKLTSIKSLTYSVLVTEKLTGCTVLESFKVTDKTIQPVVGATASDAICNPSNSGSVSASVGGNTSSYTFNWYNGGSVKPSYDYSGATYASVTAGNYTVVAINKTTGCTSDPYTVVVGSPPTNPPVAATVTTQQTSCTTPNGSAKALVSGGTAGYTFRWFKGNNTLAANLVGSTSAITNLAAGIYTAEATNITNGCTDTDLITINDVILIPTIASATVNSNLTQCSPFNGSATASAGAGSFTYYWFNGNVGTPDTLTANFKGATYNGLNAGYYTVLAVNKATRCTSARSVVQVLDNTSNPVLATSTVNQTSCNSTTPNGQASANVGGSTTGYKFRWFAGADTTVFLSQATSITNRAAGTYTVKGIVAATKCYTLKQVTISNNLVNPTVTSTIVNNSNCSGSTPTGSVTLQVNGGSDPITDFTIQWYEGNGTTVPLGTTVGSTSGTNKEKAQGLSAGIYTARITDNTTPGDGCYVTSTFNITNTPATITIAGADINITSSSNCSPVNGSASVAQVSVNGTAVGNTTGYTFTWYQTNGTTVIASSGTSATIGIPLASGSYYVKATNTVSNCSSALTSFTITDTHVNPVVAAASSVNNTNCPGSTPNGSITININGAAPVTGQFSIAWYEGNGTTTALGTTVGSVSGTNNETATALAAGTYTVVTTDLVAPNKGCVTTKSFTITSTPPVIAISSADITVTPTSNCTPVNGSASINQITINGSGIGNTTGYTFTWYQSNGTTVIPSSSTAATIATPLAAGNYFVKTTSSGSNCSSTLTAFTVTDTHVNPIVAAASTNNNTNCSASSPNGSITINIGGVPPVTGQYSIAWFEGSGTTTPLSTTVGSVSGSSSETAQALPAGTYTVTVTDLVTPNTGCVTTKSFTITSSPAAIAVNSADINVTSQSNCTPVNGSATVSQVSVNGSGIGNTTGYTFTWYQSDGTTVIPSSGTAATIATPLTAGNYYVKATSTASNCVSTLASFTVTDTHVNPTVTAASIINNTNCTGSAPTGSITINVGGISPAVGQYSLTWYEGSTATTALGTTAGSVSGINNQTAQSLPAGTYTVVVTDLIAPNAGCVTTKSFTITSSPATVSIGSADINVTAQSNCTPVNGSATINQITINGTGTGNTTGYTFTWYQSNGTTVIPSSGTTATIGTALAAGTYYVKATSTISNCSSVLASFTVTDTHVDPVVAAASTINNTNCTGSTPTGSVTISVGGIAPAVGQYSVTWYEDGGTITTLGTTVGSVSGTNNETAQGLSAGTYTAVVKDLVAPNAGCVTTKSFTITNTPVTITIAGVDINVTSQSNCTPVNGSATVNQITVNGSGIGNTTGYTFTWYQSDGITVVPSSGSSVSIGTPLAAGNYYVKATRTASNCSSSLASFTVTDTHINPAITAASTTNNINCIGSTPNGSVTINVGGVAPAAGQYSVAWFEGSGTTTGLGTTVGAVSGSNNQTAQGLSAGTYTVVVTDLAAPNAGCVSTKSFTISSTPATLTIGGGDVNVAPQSNCTPVNGSATVNQITVNGTGIGNTTGYNFTWYQSNGTTVIPSSGTTATIGTSLAAGTYFVKATNAASNCSTSLTSFTITDTHVNPAITASSTNNNTNCSGTTPNGSLTINVGGVAPAAGQYSVSWYEGSGTTTALGTTVGSASGANNETAQFLSAGTYTAVVTDLAAPNAGCISTKSFTISSNPVLVTIDNADISLTSQSNCSPANGSATINEVTVNGAGIGNTTGYTFTWYQSNGTTVIPSSGTAATIATPLAAGSYFVKATSTASNCSSSMVAFNITDTHVNPMVATISTADNTHCTGATPTGLITIQINGGADPVTDFIIDWFEGSGTTVALGTTVGITAGVNHETAQALSAGTYTVRIRDNVTPNNGCFVTATFTVNDNIISPVVNGTPAANTACDPSKANGSIIADVSGATAGYTFHIFKGQNTLSANEVTTSTATAINLKSGVYTIQAISNTTGCAGTTEVTVNDNIVLPAITNTTTTNVTSCSTPNGTASVTAVSIGLVSDYTFSWFKGKYLKATADYTGSTVPGLLAGEYTVTATNNILGCDVQTPVTVTVGNDPSTVITINELIGEQIQPAVCNNGQGQLGVQASSPANTSGFSFTWYQGDKNLGMSIEGNGQNFPINSNRISNAASSELINSGLHTVIALDNTTGCFDSLSINLPYSDEAALLSVLTFPQTDCLTPDGAFRASIQPSAGTAGNPANAALDQGWYRIDIYQTGSLIKTVSGANGTPITDPIVVTGLAAGNYTVLAVETKVPPLAGCASEPNYVNIGDSRTYPAITANTLIDDKNCAGSGSDNGSITLTIDGTPTPASGYSYDWHDGKFLTDPTLVAGNVPAPGHSAINIDAGFYTVQVTKASNNCKAEQTLHINNTPYVISIPSTDMTLVAQTNCSPANGSAEVIDVLLDGASSGGTAGYTFVWFLNDGITVVPSSTNAALLATPIAAGSYFVQATNTASNCGSPLIQFAINDNSVKPVIAVNTLIDNSNCSGASPSGSITINVDGGAPATTDFSIQWYTGTGTTAPISGATTATLSALAAGDYTVEVIDILSPGNTCSSIATFTISDDLPVYSINSTAVTITDQSDCVANGSAIITDVLIDGVSNGGVTGFSFTWLDNAGIAITGAGNAATIAGPLAAGDYRVVATNTASSCNSIVTIFTVKDVSVKPVIAANTLTDNSNCSGAAPNGSITINVNGGAPAATDFTIQWYTGVGTTAPIVGETSATVSALAAGDYTVQVTDILSPGNTCASIATFTISDDLPVYSINSTAVTVTDQSDCVANGSATVTDVLIDGVSNGGITGFSFTWLDNAGIAIAGAGNAATIAVPIAAGDYRVMATNTVSNCSSIITVFTVKDISVKPVVAANTLTDNSNCSGVAPNGSITINVNGGAPAVTDFSIQWYQGVGTTTPIVGATSATVSTLAAGDYTVQVTDILSPGKTCATIATFTIGNDIAVYSINAGSISITDQSDCVGNGSAAVTDVLINGVSNGGVAGFTFTWLDNAGIAIAGAGNAATIAIPLTAGTYRVAAINTASNCNSIVTTFSVNDVSVKPSVTVNTLTDNSNCSGASPNGSITINVDGGVPAATDFLIQWYTGNGTTAPIPGATTGTLSGLAAGNYTVQVTDILSPGNTCSSTATFTITDDLPVYSINAAGITVTDQTDCVANGSATITDVLINGISNGGTTGFTFNWLNDAGIAIAGAGNAAVIAVPIGAGDYQVVATNTTSNCTSIINAFNVKDISVKPVVTANTLIDNSNCNGASPNGSITINVDGSAPLGTDFTIQWYTGTGISSPIPSATAATLTGLAAGNYTVEVIDILSPGNTCSSIAIFTISDDLPVYSINAAAIIITDQSDCVSNGSATITDILIDGVSNGGVTGFTFTWLDNSGVAIAGAGNAATIAVPLAAGSYRVRATNNSSTCTSIISGFNVKDVSVKPVIAVNTLIDNSNCSGATPNGSIKINVDGGAPATTDFSIQWYTGTGTTAPISGATTATLSALAAGEYTVEVIDILSPGNTCSSIATFTISDDLPVYSINSTAVTITDQSDCVANGAATITDVLIDGVSNGGVAGFSFTWFDNAGIAIAGAGNAATIAVPLAAGDYRVVATNTASSCNSIVTLFTVKDVSVKPVIAANTLTDNSNCSGAAPNGLITINVNASAPAITDFSIQWYTGIGTTAPIVGATSATISALAAGDYTVQVTDILSPGNTCASIATFTISDDLPVYSINSTAVTVTDQSDCVANGSATVTDVLIDGVSNGGVTGFSFTWLDNAGVAIAGAGNAATIAVPIAAGDYRVMAISTVSNCSSIITVFTVKDISVKPVVAANTLTDNSNCGGATPNGSITINVNGGAPAVTDFSIQWYQGVGTTTPIVGATSATISTLAAGDYTVQVIDILSPGNTCATIATFTIDNTPNVIGLDNSLMTITDNTNCSPVNGSAAVTKVLFNGAQDGNTGNYTFEWLHADHTAADPSTSSTVTAPLAAGDYIVRATHTGSTCVSTFTPFTIKDKAQIPVVTAVKDIDNISCNSSYTGRVSASVSEGLTNGVTSGYLFEWFKGMNNTNGADFIANGATLSGLQEGVYTIRVTDNTVPSRNCVNVTSINVGRQIPVLNGTLTTTPQTTCAPIQDGKIVANTVQVFVLSSSTVYDMNITADRNMFTFQWYNESLAPITGPITGNNNSPLLEGGVYYGRLTDGLGCTSDYIEQTVDDTTVKPAVSVQEFVNPAVCVLPELKGSILVTADNNPNFSDYTFEWHEGSTIAGTLVEPNSPLLTNISYTGVSQYTVKVSNNATQCVTLETYKFTTDTLDIRVVASAVPLTNCVADNGSLFAATRTGSGQLYDIEWYIGSNVGSTPDFTGNEVLIAPVGTYTATAKHPTLAFCKSIPDVVSITDERTYPTVMATLKDPLTYCDPSNPNGVAFASVNGNITDYVFDWYEGSLTGKLTYTGSEAGVLKALSYIVKGTNTITGCYGTTTVNVTSDFATVPAPDVTLISNLANCTTPDGELSAAVNGITKDHIFSWYIGSTIKAQPDAVGEMYGGLVDGIYSVTATDRASGCTSVPVQKDVTNIQEYPEFDIKTINTSCDGAVGTAKFIPANDAQVQTVQWDIAGDVENGPQIEALPSGTFSVTVITLKDCQITKSFLVNTDITIYNGVSRNSDGKNDFFELGCIAEYPNNSVRIFNRSGSLVYEAKGYDNQDIYFNGVSNRGVNILGHDLPDGTYFYIISKGDGSEDKTGYLELLH